MDKTILPILITDGKGKEFLLENFQQILDLTWNDLQTKKRIWPKKDGRYLIKVKRQQCSLQKLFIKVEIAKYDGSFRTDDVFEHIIDNVLGWMQLPKSL